MLVVAQAEEAGLSEPSVRCPFGESDLRHKVGARPMSPARHGPRVGERRLRDLQLAQPNSEFGEPLGAVARPDLSCITEQISLVVADEQRTEVGSAAGG